AGEGSPLPAPLGTRVADFNLPRSAGGPSVSLVEETREARAVVVLFLGTRCPVNNAYAPVLAALHKKYNPRGVVFLGINSNQHDDAEAIARHAQVFGLPFPVLKDEGAAVADQFRAQRVPEAFVLDGTRKVRYRGRIDDQFDKGVKRPKASRHDLAEAIEDVLAGKDVARPVTEAAGCPISRPARPCAKKPLSPAVTYCNT